jgi:hypothetical protein
MILDQKELVKKDNLRLFFKKEIRLKTICQFILFQYKIQLDDIMTSDII